MKIFYLVEFLGRVQAGKDPQHVAVGNDPQQRRCCKKLGRGYVGTRSHTKGIIWLHLCGLEVVAGHRILPVLKRHIGILINEGPAWYYLIYSVSRLLFCTF